MRGDLHARAWHRSITDGAPEGNVREVGRPEHANRRESRHQRLAGVGDTDDDVVTRVVTHRGHVAGGIGQWASDDVDVGVDEAGKQRCVAEVDRARAAGDRDRSGAPDGGDPVVGDDDDAVRDWRGPGSVDHSRGAKDNGSGAGGFLGGRGRCGEEESEETRAAHHAGGWGWRLNLPAPGPDHQCGQGIRTKATVAVPCFDR
jgi:hypothetical protein